MEGTLTVLQYQNGWPPGFADGLSWIDAKEYVEGYKAWLETLPQDEKGRPILPGRF